MTELDKLRPLIRKMRRMDDTQIEIELDFPFDKVAAIEGSGITDDRNVISAKVVGIFRQGEINQTSTNLDILYHSFRHLVIACRAWHIAARKIDKIKTRSDASRNVTFTLPGRDAAISFTVKVKVKEKAFSLLSSEEELATQFSREVAQAAAFIVALTQRAYQQL